MKHEGSVVQSLLSDWWFVKCSCGHQSGPHWLESAAIRALSQHYTEAQS